MRLMITIDLDNRHRQDAPLLEDEIKELLLAFNCRTGAAAIMKPMASFGYDAEVMVGRYPARVEGRRLPGPMSTRRRS